MAAQPVYRVWFMKYTEAWYKLTPEEQSKLQEQNEASFKRLGVENVVFCSCLFASEEWLCWGVQKFPDMEALHKHTQALWDLKWFQYVESKTYLGTELPE
jgi:hypothetical protein